MKRTLLPIVTLGFVAGFAGCVNLDEKLITGVSSQYYSTPDGLNSAVIAGYGQLRNYYGREQLISLAQAGTDTWMAGDQAGSNNQDFDKYNGVLNSQAAPVTNTWNPAYQMINTLNAALDKGPSTTGIPAATKATLLGEAHFLRAFEYFTLVQTFGDVTLSLHENQGVVASASRDPASEVYKAIIADLDTAVASLPVTTPNVGRATRGAALTLRSKVYLTRAYKSYTPNKTADFNSALADAKEVIASGAYSLEPVFADLWCVARSADPGRSGYCDNTGYNGNRKEFIFTVQFNSAQPTDVASQGDQYNYLHLVYLGQYDNSAASVGIARDLNNGRPFRRLMPTQYGLSVWSNRFIGTPGASDILDTRFDGSYQTVWIATAGGQKNPAGTCPACTSNTVINVGDTTSVMQNYAVTDAFRKSKPYMIRTWCPAGIADPSVVCPNVDVNETTNGYINWQRYPALKKFQDNNRATLSDQNGFKTQVIFRLAEVYLLAAEADVNLGNTAEAASMINVLRVRAATPAHKSDNNVTAAQIAGFPNVSAGVAAGLDFVMEERERELAGEFTRWYDITRPGAQYFVDRVKKYNPRAAANVALKHALRPIPQGQIDGVTVGTPYPQNPGY